MIRIQPKYRDGLFCTRGNTRANRARGELFSFAGKACCMIKTSNTISRFVLLVGALGAVRAAKPAPVDVTPGVKTEREDASLFEAANQSFDLRSTSIQTLRFAEGSESTLTTAIVVDGDTWTLDLEKHSVRSPDFQVWEQNASGQLTLIEAPPVQTYVGTVLEIPGSEVRASYRDGEIDAVVYAPDGVFGIQPLASVGVAAQAGEHAVYRNSDWVNRSGYGCATDVGLQVFDGTTDLETEDHPGTAGGAYKVAEIGLDADFEFFQLNGSNTNATILDMESIINGMETIYESQLNITFQVSSVVVRTADPDPYSSTDPSALLGQFVNHWNASPQSGVQRDLLHLFTGKNLDTSVIGIAYIGAVCNRNWAYGLSQSRFTNSMTSRVALTAHEIGHNWNADHCNGCTGCTNCCRIMCSGLGGCSGILNSFGCQEVAQIASFRDTRTCLATGGGDDCSTPADCDDGLSSTVDTCVSGACIYTPVNCNDNVACTTDQFVQSSGACTHTPNHGYCNPASSFCSAAHCDPVDGCVFDHECVSTSGNPCPAPATCNETTDTCGGCKQPTVVAAGCRYLSVTPASQGSTSVALLVTGDCQAPNAACVDRYVQSKCVGGANDGLNCDTNADCPKQCAGGVNPGAPCVGSAACPFGVCAGQCEAGTLGSTPYYKLASEWGTIKVRGAQIRPETTYLVHTECDFAGPNVLSSAASAATWRWGDTDGDGDVEATDIAHVVNAYKGIFGSLTFEQVNLWGCVPDAFIDALDVGMNVDAFKGRPFPCTVTCP